MLSFQPSSTTDQPRCVTRLWPAGTPGRIQVTRRTYELLLGEFQLERRGTIEVRGLGEMETWYLLGAQGSLPAEKSAKYRARARDVDLEIKSSARETSEGSRVECLADCLACCVACSDRLGASFQLTMFDPCVTQNLRGAADGVEQRDRRSLARCRLPLAGQDLVES